MVGEPQFCTIYDCVKKQILASAIGFQKENWGITTHFSEIIEPQFGKCVVTPNFLFGFK